MRDVIREAEERYLAALLRRDEFLGVAVHYTGPYSEVVLREVGRAQAEYMQAAILLESLRTLETLRAVQPEVAS